MNPLKLLVVSTTLNTGGAERFVSTLLTHLDREVVRPSLCLLRDDVGYPLPDDVPLTALDYRKPWHFPRTANRLRKLIERTRPDVLLSNITATSLVCGMALRRCRHQPVWIARIGSNPTQLDGTVRTLIARQTYQRVDRFVVNASGLSASLADYYPVASGRIDTIYNPTDFDWIDEQASLHPSREQLSDAPVLVAMGRISREKRYDVLLDAFARVRRRRLANLWICGDGPLRSQLQREIRNLDLDDSIRLLGFCQTPYSILRQATLFVLSSDTEGLPNALIEAQALGIPAVSTRCPHGPDEIVDDGKTGLLVPVGDAAAMSGAILSLLDDEPRRQQMAAVAHQRTRERFAVERLTRKWEKLFLEQAGRQVPNETCTGIAFAELAELPYGGTVESCTLS